MDLDPDEALRVILDRDVDSGIDNIALDFSELEEFIINDGGKALEIFQNDLNDELKLCDLQQKSEKGLPNLASSLSCFPASPASPVITTKGNPNADVLLVLQLNHKESICPSLPDSPPDSGSDPPLSPIHSGSEPPFSPAHSDNSMNGNESSNSIMQTTGDLKQYMGYGSPHTLKHLNETSLTITPSMQISNQQNVQVAPHSNVSQSLSVVPSQSASVGSLLGHLQHQPMAGLSLGQQSMGPSSHMPSLYDGEDFLCDNMDTSSVNHKKRKLTDGHKSVLNNNLMNGMMNVKQEDTLSQDPNSNTVLSPTDEGFSFDFAGSEGSAIYLDPGYQCIRFQPFQQNTWAILCDHTLKELPPPNYRVDADKGFNFSNADDAFVCQKKNHFQVTVHIQPIGDAHYVKTPDGVKKVDHFYLHFNGAKVEAPNQTIKVEQSQSDRSKKPYHPLPLDLHQEQVNKSTIGRLHFSETTSNNMRKKGKPNPDQRYFYLVVSLCVASGDLSYTVISHASERIIVRASNPGQFENDMELSWQRGQLADSIYHAGRVGINTDRPDEALVIHGNVKVTGHIVQPSDGRAKTNIEEVDTKEQLKNVANMRIVRYQYLPEFAKQVGLDVNDPASTGVIAQEVQSIIPDAVQGAGDVLLPDGKHIDNFLVVNKDRIFMENIGAVKELCKVTDNLGNRIDELEKVNKKLNQQKLKRADSFKSTSSNSTVTSHSSSLSGVKKAPCRHRHRKSHQKKRSPLIQRLFGTNNYLYIIVIILLLIMAFSFLSMVAIYAVEKMYRYVPTPTPGVPVSNVSNSRRENSLISFNTLEKSHSNSENVINVQANKKEPKLTDYGSTSYSKWLSRSTASTQLSSTTPFKTFTIPNVYQNPTSIPILKPRIIGTPSQCRSAQQRYTECYVYCCSMSSTQRKATFDDNEDGNVSSPSVGINLSDPNLNNDNLPKDGQDLITSSDNYLLDQSTPSEKPYTKSTPAFPLKSSPSPTPSVDSEHLLQQNQLKPIRGILLSHRAKLISERNNETDMNEEIAGKIAMASQLDEKMRNVLRVDRTEVDKRTRRGAKQFSKKDLPKAIESLRLLELNVTVGQQYCNTLQCAHRSGPRFSYLIPVSKYMKEEYLTLQFNLGVPLIVDHCPLGEMQIACPVPQNGAGDLPHNYIREQNLTEEMDPSWRLPIGLYLRSTYTFRVLAKTMVSDMPCSLPLSELGRSYIEFLFTFQRTCDK